MKKKKLLYALLEIIILVILVLLTVLAYNAHQIMKSGQALLESGNYAAAQEAFSKAGGHEKSPEYAKYAQALQQVLDGKFDDAQAALSELGSFEEAPAYLQYVTARKAQDAKEWQTAMDGYTGTEPLLDSADRAQECRIELSKQQYKEAADLYAQGQLEEAGNLFATLGDYSDSADRAAEIQAKLKMRDDYAKALQLQSEGKLQEAYDILSTLGTYEDSAERAAELKEGLPLLADYQAADKLEQSGNLEEARQAFLLLDDYRDSADRAAALRDKQNEAVYQVAVTAESKGKMSEAYAGFIAAGDYKDASAKAAAILTSIQGVDDKAGSEQAAAGADSSALDQESMYQFALKLIENSQWEQARTLLASMKDYKKAEVKLLEVNDELANQKAYREACIAFRKGDLVAAQSAFEVLGDYKDSATQLERVKQALTKTPDAANAPTGTEKMEFVDEDGTTHIYQILEGCKTWNEARQYCESIGGHLATLTTEEENQRVYDFVAANGYTSVYFGLSDIKYTGTWVWVTGEPFDYDNWHEGEPNREFNEKYGMYLDIFADSTWNDSHFGEGTSSPGAPFICEWEQ